MKLTKKQELEARKLYAKYWDSYTKGDLKGFSSTLDEAFEMIGTSESEVCHSKAEGIKFYKAQMKETVGKAEMRNRRISVKAVNGMFLFNETADIYILDKRNWTFYAGIRLSTLLHETKSGWKVIQQHGSFPDMRVQEGETIAFEKISKENLELRDAVKRATVELETKNRNLKTEASLERVRTVAMGMKKSGDLLAVCKTGFRELKKLGFADLRNMIIHTYVDEQKYFNDYDYSDTLGGAVAKVPYTGNPVIEKFIRTIRKGKSAFSEIKISGKQLEDWKKFRKANKEPFDPRLNKAKALYYYIYSVGSGSIGVSTFSPIDDEKRNILVRFRNVFDLSYQRYMDIQKAETQAREAQIQLALERVRARTMAMQKSDELYDVAHLLHEQFKSLGQTTIQMTIGIGNEAEKLFDVSVTDWSGQGKTVFAKYKMSFAEASLVNDLYNAWKKSKPSVVIELRGERLKKWVTYRNKLSGVKIKADKPRIITAAFFSKGFIAFSKHEASSIASVQLLERFAVVFNQTYARFLDLQKAEAQAREAQIQLALERVRARTMAMHRSDELTDVVKLLYQEFDKLKLSNESTDIEIGLIDEETGVASIWAHFYLSDGSITTFKMPIADFKGTIDEYKIWKATAPEKRNELFFTSDFSGRHWKRIIDWVKKTPELAEIFQPLLDARIKRWVTHNAYFSHGLLTLQGTEPYSQETQEIQKRFTKVFEQTYTRFLDLQKAEAQAREAQIEAALEKVRSRSLAMHKSDEIEEVLHTVFEKLKELGIDFYTAIIILFSKDSKDIVWWLESKAKRLYPKMLVPYADIEYMRNLFDAREKGIELFSKCYLNEEKIELFRHLFEHTGFANVPEEQKKFLWESEFATISVALANNTAIHITSYSRKSFSNQDNDVLKRFAKVFEQAYTRFLDLQKAEAQVREAQIEAAVERVRARALAMHRSEDLHEVVVVLKKEMMGLQIPSVVAATIYLEQDDGSIRILDLSGGSENVYDPSQLQLDKVIRLEETDPQLWIRKIWKSTENYFVLEVDEADFERVIAFLYTVDPPGAEIAKNFIHGQGIKKAWLPTVKLAKGKMNIDLLQPPAAEVESILLKMGAGFDLAYKRFLDLQKAEAQAREAQIEASLERVRSRTMAMQKSDELLEAGELLCSEMKRLGITSLTSGFVLMDADKSIGWNYTPNPGTGKIMPAAVGISHVETAEMQRVLECWKNKDPFSIIEMGEEQTIRHQTFIAERSINFPLSARELLAISPKKLVLHNFNFKEGYILIVGGEKLANDQIEIMLRFTNVFQQTYTRFLDLQKAEAQAREAQIEAALERVRSKAMAMHKSDELAGVVAVLYKQFEELGFGLYQILVSIFDTKNNVIEWWSRGFGDVELPQRNLIPIIDHPFSDQQMEAWKSGMEYRPHILEADMKASWEEYLFTQTDLKYFPDEVKKKMRSIDRVYLSDAYMKYGALQAAGPEPLPDDKAQVLLRFAKVLDQAYTRMKDLQHAEAQAREAQIEAALERVRSKAMAMHSSQDLADTIGVFYNELKSFSITPRRCGVGLLNKENKEGELFTWNTTEQGESLELVGKLKMEGHPILENVYSGWLSQTDYFPVLRGNEIKEYYKVIRPMMAFPDYDHDEVQYGYFFFFNEGGVYAWTQSEMQDDEVQIYRRFTSVLSLTYKRYKDLQQAEALADQARLDLIQIQTEKKRAEEALAELQSTQKQLIQSEKMASLGELTAGIAHEIQNPLNFVNNFSEVSKELLDEMKEALEKGDTDDAKGIMNDVIQNLEKINHHGRRADGIVKGMLQHSRSSSGVKEATDINALCDEYLRLAYHGLRAKDKSFNAKFGTHFDETIGKINVMPQEMGRVILNLINNAFYAVSERFKQTQPGSHYEPTVTVSTRKTATAVEIKVSDNGTGIPQKALDKIFQPFFTTKPTGQGTGLGLSLSYDIVKAHGGELKVNTIEGEGTKFIIILNQY